MAGRMSGLSAIETALAGLLPELAPGTVLDRRGEPPGQIFLRADGRLVGLVEALAGAPMRQSLKMPAGERILGIAVPAFLAICREEPKLSLTLATHLARRVWGHRPPPPGGWAMAAMAAATAAPAPATAPAPAATAPACPPNRPLLPAEKALALLESDLFRGQSSRALLGIAESFVTRFYAPGTPLGDVECLLGRPWREPVAATSATVTLEAGRDDFLRLLYQLPDLPFDLARHLARRCVEVLSPSEKKPGA